MVVANVELLRCWVADLSLRPLGLAAVTLDIFIFTTPAYCYPRRVETGSKNKNLDKGRGKGKI